MRPRRSKTKQWATLGAIRAASVLALAATLGACYTYTPIQGRPSVGSEVRARLTAATALAQSELAGEVTQDFRGRVTYVSADSVTLSVVAVQVATVSASQTRRRLVGLPLSGIEEMSVRELSLARTSVTVAAAGGVVVAILGGVLTTGGGSDGDGNGDPALRPGFRISWPF